MNLYVYLTFEYHILTQIGVINTVIVFFIPDQGNKKKIYFNFINTDYIIKSF